MSASVKIRIPEWLDRICVWPVMKYRKRKYGWPFRRIYLGEGEWAMLDAQDYYKLNEFKWVISGNGTKFYAVRMVKKGPGKTRIEYLHRVIMEPAKGLLVDHRNRNTFDNRRDNLRTATHSENSYNKPKRKNTSSQYVGVTKDKRCGRWEAIIYAEGKRIRLGRFDNEIDAARAYDSAAKKYHGEFARLNFPDFKPSASAQGTENTPLLKQNGVQSTRAEENKMTSRERNPVRKWLRRAKILKILKMGV